MLATTPYSLNQLMETLTGHFCDNLVHIGSAVFPGGCSRFQVTGMIKRFFRAGKFDKYYLGVYLDLSRNCLVYSIQFEDLWQCPSHVVLQ